jgi:hypothetical protein
VQVEGLASPLTMLPHPESYLVAAVDHDHHPRTGTDVHAVSPIAITIPRVALTAYDSRIPLKHAQA